MAEDFDLDGIQKLTDELDACWVNWFFKFPNAMWKTTEWWVPAMKWQS
jgi:hypothetical protein